MTEDKAPDKGKQGRRPPKKATAKHLENVALWYLQRFAASADSLRRVLMRRVEKSARAHDTDRDEGAAFVEDIIARFRASSLLDDRVYAEGRTLSLHRRGISTRGIRARLAAKGVGADDIDAALAMLRDQTADPDLAAAIAYARRRRIGPYRTRGDREEMRERDLAALARQGFGYDIARRVIEALDIGELEAGTRL
ncbi:MAG: RecX family transcriptional regulator [Alphaproteobacteria bacterium]|jgi:regulatory protein|nr:RecX family transcriptional regulator [Alphaproteobacteria bacterium]